MVGTQSVQLIPSLSAVYTVLDKVMHASNCCIGSVDYS